MAFSDLASSVGQNGFWQGLQNYVGNNTGFGQVANGLDNAYQGLTGQPKQQLIGQPASQINPAVSSQPSKAEMINAHAAQQASAPDNSMFDKITGQPLQDVRAPSSGGSSSSGSGIGQLAGIAAAFI